MVGVVAFQRRNHQLHFLFCNHIRRSAEKPPHDEQRNAQTETYEIIQEFWNSVGVTHVVGVLYESNDADDDATERK